MFTLFAFFISVCLCLPPSPPGPPGPTPITTKTTTITSSNFTFDPIVPDDFGPHEPQQVHLTYFSESPVAVGVTWSTWEHSLCFIWSSPPTLSEDYSVTEFVDGGSLNHTQYIHFVKLFKVQPGQTYTYTINCDAFTSSGSTSTPSSSTSPTTTSSSASSRTFSFSMPSTEAPDTFLILGDCGLQNFISYDRLLSEAEQGAWKVILHNGDFAYDMYNDNGTRGDMFMNLMEPIGLFSWLTYPVSAYPYMVSVGNHEAEYNFSHYRYRFNMPLPQNFENCCPYGENAFYSWNFGLVHFVVYSTEVYFWPDQVQNAQPMLEWLEQDLKAANQNRDEQPWIVVMGHRPMYSSSIPMTGNIVRDTLEDLFCTQGVDVVLEAHEHSYERTFPVYNGTMAGGPVEPYTDYGAPIHLINGNMERHEPWLYEYNWYGYGHLIVFNSTHMLWEQIFDLSPDPIDSVWFIQNQHGSYKCTST